ncbi:MAG: BatD family protein [Rikenellaceae bacterium]
MKKILAVLFITLLSYFGASAQSISFTATSPLSVEEGQRFNIQLTLENGQGSDFIAPEFTGVEVLYGPSVSRGSQTSIVNGVRSQSSQETYTYHVQALSGVGIAKVGSASITVDGTKYTTKPLSISVISGGSQGTTQGASSATQNSGQQRPTQQGGTTQQQPTAVQGDSSEDVMLRMVISNTNPYVGEAVSAQLKLYTRVAVTGVNNPKYPSLSGFWTQELQVPQNNSSGRVTIGGKVYESFTLRSWLLYPQKSGKVTIDATSLNATVQIVNQTGGRGGSIFDQFFGGGTSRSIVDRSLKTGATTLNVKPLPGGAPVGSSPSVGSFTLSSKLSDTTMSANSAGSLVLTLKGSGDFPLMDAPSFKLPAEFEQYDTKTTDNLKTSTSGTTGTREWEFPFVARSEGHYTIPSVEFVYFNTKSKTYETLRSPEYSLEVTRDNNSSGGTSLVTGVNREDLKILSRDIHYIKTGSRADNFSLLIYSSWFFIIILIIITAGVLALVYLKKVTVLKADVRRTKTRKASKVALRRLKAAKREMTAGGRAGFFEEVLRAMLGFVGDKYSIAVSELTKERIESEFSQRGVREEVATDFIALIEECEMARYAPSTGGDMLTIYNRTLKVFDEL